MSGLVLTSESFYDGDYIANDHVLSEAYGFGCAGGNLSPQLSWSGAPEGTQSYAISCFDPDAPTGSGFWHWMVVNIPATTTSLSLGGGDMPAGALEVRTDFGAPGYGGPCPPEGDHPHRYVFKLHAVGIEALPFEPPSCAVAGFLLHFNSLATASLMGLYKR